MIGEGGGLLHGRERGNERRKLAHQHARDRKILDRAQSLDPVKCVTGDITKAEEVMLSTRGGSHP